MVGRLMPVEEEGLRWFVPMSIIGNVEVIWRNAALACGG